jgi:hypothetical protein
MMIYAILRCGNWGSKPIFPVVADQLNSPWKTC